MRSAMLSCFGNGSRVDFVFHEFDAEQQAESANIADVRMSEQRSELRLADLRRRASRDRSSLCGSM